MAASRVRAQAFGAPEPLHGENAYLCEACDKKAKAAQAQAQAEAAAEAVEEAEAVEVAAEASAESTRQPAIKWLQLACVPRVLTVHLKRFRSSGRKVHKLDEHVRTMARPELTSPDLM